MRCVQVNSRARKGKKLLRKRAKPREKKPNTTYREGGVEMVWRRQVKWGKKKWGFV